MGPLVTLYLYMPPAFNSQIYSVTKDLLKAGWTSANGVNGLPPLGPVAKYIKGTEPLGLNHETLASYAS